MIWTYIQSEPGLWTVGHYAPDGRFVPESDHDSIAGAAERIHYLNGGAHQILTDIRDVLSALTEALEELTKASEALVNVVEFRDFSRPNR